MGRQKTCFYNSTFAPIMHQSRNSLVNHESRALLNHPSLNYSTWCFSLLHHKLFCPCLSAVKAFDALHWPGEDRRGCVRSLRSAPGRAAGVDGSDGSHLLSWADWSSWQTDFHRSGWGHVCVYRHYEHLSAHVYEQL